MKKIVIYTTNDKVISLKLVDEIISNNYFDDYQIDILLTKASFLRKIKILIVMIFFGSIKKFFFQLQEKISIEEILRKNKNCKLINKVEENYDFGLSVYCSSKIKIQNFKIYNFHLGNLFNQRGSFIFFYKFIKNWDNINLTFHEISEKFDVGLVINEREIKLNKNHSSSDIFFIYLDNLDFLMESIRKINNGDKKNYKDYGALNTVPNFYILFKEIIFYYLIRK